MNYRGDKIAFVFPGQGSQYIGMGVDFYENNLFWKGLFSDFTQRTNIDLIDIMTNGPEEKLKETMYTQPAILTHSVMCLKSLTMEHEVLPDFVAGHSLGEYSALVAAEVLDPKDATYLVHKRGEFMMKANENTPFGMSAVLGLDSDAVREICQEASKHHLVVAANFNTPIQTVISGTKEGIELATTLAKEKGAKRVLPLAVGGPFHSPLIKRAGIWLAEEIEKIDFRDAKCPVICNVNAQPETDAEKIKQNLIDQVTSPVLWVDSIKYMHQQGVSVFIEMGPQKVLKGMIEKIVENPVVYNIEKYNDFTEIIKLLENL